MKYYPIAVALVALAAPAAAQGKMSPQSCYGSPNVSNLQQWLAHKWNNGMIPCFRDSNLQACQHALGNAAPHCVVKIQVQMARIYHNNRDAVQAYVSARSAAQADPSEADAWIIMGMHAQVDARGFSDQERFQNLRQNLQNIMTNLDRLSLTPEQTAQRDALAQRVATMDANVAKAKADAETKTAALNQQAEESAKKACGWFCSDQDRQYYQWCYREGINNNAPKAQTDHWCSCSLKYYKNALSANKLAYLIQRLSGPRAAPQGGGLAGFERGLHEAMGDMELMTYAIQAQNSCSR